VSFEVRKHRCNKWCHGEGDDRKARELQDGRQKIGPEKFDAFMAKYSWLDQAKYVLTLGISCNNYEPSRVGDASKV